MEETIVIPSPNWFNVSILGASQDGWLLYGGPSKSLCLLEPLDGIGTIDSKQRFKAHVFQRAHKDRIVSVDISLGWPEKRNFITGSYDGVVKEWNMESKDGSWTLNYLHCHEEHSVQNEELAGVCYGTQTIAVSVGSSGNICKWDLNTNVLKRYSAHLKNFKPTCMSASPHRPLHIAVGTRQGVIFVIDINGFGGKLIYKIRAQDDEINRVSWCPQFSVTINKPFSKRKETLNNKRKETFSVSSRMDRIRNNLEPSESLEAAIAERNSTVENKITEQPEEEVIIPEDDMFDVYKDHEADEFGHKKYVPEDMYIKVKAEVKDDFLAECEKLKAEILKKKNEPVQEDSIESLVEALDKAHVEEIPTSDRETKQESPAELQESTVIQESTQAGQGSSQDAEEKNEYKHLLASIGKYGGVRVWTQTGKLLASCIVLLHIKKDMKDRSRGPNWPTLHWFKADSLLIADGKNQLLETNPLKIGGKNKLEWRVMHSLHRRGLYVVTSNAPRVQTPELVAEPGLTDNWVVWTVGQDRNIISYNMKEEKTIEIMSSCGSFMYKVQPCAYDAGKMAVAAGDGSLRVWETHTTNELEDQLASGRVTAYWQNVQGKVLNVAWHPTKENILAFSTAEARVGILEANGSPDKPAKTFANSFKNSVYSLCWGEGMHLYACGNGELALFRANKTEEKARPIPVVVEGQTWEISEVVWTPHGIVVGALNGGIALLDHKNYKVITATFVFLKIIYTVAWHPQQTTSSLEESTYRNYIAVCSSDKEYTIAILEFEDKGDGAQQFTKIMEPLAGHENAVLQVAWNPHRDAQLLSTSQDSTVRIWNVAEGVCIAIFGGHSLSAQGGMWCTHPRLADKVLSCGGDSCLRLWDIKDYPVESFRGVRKELPKKKKQSNRAREEARRVHNRENIDDTTNNPNRTEPITANADQTQECEAQPGLLSKVATTFELKLRGSRRFLLPITAKQINKRSMSSVRTILTEHIEENNGIDIKNILKTSIPKEKHMRFLKLFGTLNELNELLDFEAENHKATKEWESYLILLFYRGRIDEMIQFAAEHDLLDPYLLCLTPTISHKFWKDSAMLMKTQIRRLSVKRREGRTWGFDNYGGKSFCDATISLSMHDVMDCIELLIEAYLYKEAYMLCRLRHMDSIAEEVLRKWAHTLSTSGSLMMAAILFLVCGDVSEASITLGRSNQIKHLKLAAQLAHFAGHHTFATHMEGRVATKESEMGSGSSEEELEDLPTRVELLNGSESDDDSDEEICIKNARTVNGVDRSNAVGKIASSSPLNGNDAATLNEKDDFKVAASTSKS